MALGAHVFDAGPADRRPSPSLRSLASVTPVECADDEERRGREEQKDRHCVMEAKDPYGADLQVIEREAYLNTGQPRAACRFICTKQKKDAQQ